MRASFLFVGDFNGHHQEWFDSTTSNRHGVAALTSQLCLIAICWLSVNNPVEVLNDPLLILV